MEKMKSIRKSQGYTQSDVAKALGITFQTYSSYETGNSKPNPNMLCKLADFFGVTVDELLGRTSAPGIFDDARVPKTEIQELFDALTPAQQQNLLNYARGMAVSNEITLGDHIKRKVY